MPNPVRVKKVPVQLDKERHLVYDMNAFCELEERFGTLQQAMEELQKGSLKAIRTALWAGLVHEDESLTEKQVGAMIGVVDLQDVAKKMAEAIQAALPEADAKN